MMIVFDMMSALNAVIYVSTILNFASALPKQVICGSTPKNSKVGLVSELLNEEVYNPALKPTIDDHKQVQVHVGFVLSRIRALDERSQSILTIGYLDFRWYDELLTWDPALYNGIDRLILKPDMVWLPEVEMLNSAEPASDIPLSLDFRVEVRHDGLMRWSPAMQWNTLCPLDLSFFPFDKQTCEVILFNRMYRSSSVNLTIHNDEVIMPPNIHVANREWILTNQSLKREDIDFTETITINNTVVTHTYDIPVVRMVLHMQREPLFYLLSILLPTLIVAIISMFVYILPSDSGEKIGFSITVLLSYFVILLYVSDMTPRTGSTVPYISVYISLCMISNCLSLIATVLILNIYHHHPYTRVPKIFRVLSFGCCARVLCLDTKAHKMKKEPPPNQTMNKASLNRQSSVTCTDENSNHGDSLRSGINFTQSQLKFLHTRQSFQSQLSFSQNRLLGSLPRSSTISMETVKGEVEEEKESDEEIQERNRVEWALFARVTDRFMFLLSAIFIIGMTAVYFMALKFSALSETLSNMSQSVSGAV